MEHERRMELEVDALERLPDGELERFTDAVASLYSWALRHKTPEALAKRVGKLAERLRMKSKEVN